MAGCGATETTAEEPKKEVDGEKKKKLNDDIVVFIRKRSGLDAPRLIAKLKSYVKFQNKRRHANAVRKRTEDARARNKSKKRVTVEQKKKPEVHYNDHRGREDDQASRRCHCNKQLYKLGWWSANNSEDLIDCGCRTRRRKCSRRRRRSRCRRRRSRCRRRRSRCRRRRSCRRRRRSRCRRRRRRSCRRRRRCSRRRRRR